MSRIGKKPIIIPKYVEVKIKNNEIFVKGKLGSIINNIPNYISLSLSKDILLVNRIHEDKKSKSSHGLYRMLIYNMIKGVDKGFEKKLELVGIGYKAICEKYGTYNENILILNLGFSHEIIIQIPKEIIIEIESKKGKNITIKLKSYNKQLLGIYAAKIRSLRPPEPYKGKGIRYCDEEVIRKTGKSA